MDPATVPEVEESIYNLINGPFVEAISGSPQPMCRRCSWPFLIEQEVELKSFLNPNISFSNHPTLNTQIRNAMEDCSSLKRAKLDEDKYTDLINQELLQPTLMPKLCVMIKPDGEFTDYLGSDYDDLGYEASLYELDGDVGEGRKRQLGEMYAQLWKYHTDLKENQQIDEFEAYQMHGHGALLMVVERRARLLREFYEEYMSATDNLMFSLKRWRENCYVETEHFELPPVWPRILQYLEAQNTGGASIQSLLTEVKTLFEMNAGLISLLKSSENSYDDFNLVVAHTKVNCAYMFTRQKIWEAELMLLTEAEIHDPVEDDLRSPTWLESLINVLERPVERVNLSRDLSNSIEASVVARTRLIQVLIEAVQRDYFQEFSIRRNRLPLVAQGEYQPSEYYEATHGNPLRQDMKTIFRLENQLRPALEAADFPNHPMFTPYLVQQLTTKGGDRMALLDLKLEEFRLYTTIVLEQSLTLIVSRDFEKAILARQTKLQKLFGRCFLTKGYDFLTKLIECTRLEGPRGVPKPTHFPGESEYMIREINYPGFHGLPFVGQPLHPEIEKYLRIFYSEDGGARPELYPLFKYEYEDPQYIDLLVARKTELELVKKSNWLLNLLVSTGDIWDVQKFVEFYSRDALFYECHNPEFEDLCTNPNFQTLTRIVLKKCEFLQIIIDYVANLFRKNYRRA